MSRSEASVTKRRSGSTSSTRSFDAGPPAARTLPVAPSAEDPSSSARTTPGFQLDQRSMSVHSVQTRSRETGASTECSKSHIVNRPTLRLGLRRVRCSLRCSRRVRLALGLSAEVCVEQPGGLVLVPGIRWP